MLSQINIFQKDITDATAALADDRKLIVLTGLDAGRISFLANFYLLCGTL